LIFFDFIFLYFVTHTITGCTLGTVDFFGLNHYSCFLVAATETGMPEGRTRILFTKDSSISLSHDEGNFLFFDPAWPGSQTWWLKFTPTALRPLLRMIKDTYGNPEVIITENGIPDGIGNMEDVDRANYFTAYLNETLKAAKLDGVNVSGYMAWGLLDQWEWMTGHESVVKLD
jgi:beta-glucosidase/6-phospho-beta-glucosidase/beta-galactosidase